MNELEKETIKQAIDDLGSKVWGPLNMGQAQCGCCSDAYFALEEVLSELNNLLTEKDNNSE